MSKVDEAIDNIGAFVCDNLCKYVDKCTKRDLEAYCTDVCEFGSYLNQIKVACKEDKGE